MYYINMKFNDYFFSSVGKEDFITINQWLIEQGEYVGPQEYKENFLAYYITENEIFIKIENEGNIIGVFKGRVEYDNERELIILYYLIDKMHRRKGVGKKILCEITKYFNDRGFSKNKVIVNAKNTVGVEFWNANGFQVKRRLYKYFNNEDMLILEKA